MVVNSTLQFSHSDSVTFPGTIGGAGQVVQAGPGVLHLTAEARRILAESVPPMVAHERRMLSELTPAEQQTLSKLLAKLVVDSPNWSIEENRE